jgi:hypothetical protein
MANTNPQVTRLKDRDWVRKSFMLSAGSVSDSEAKWGVMTTASLKFTDTRLGGNFCINNPPQYTRWADIKAPGRFHANQSPIAGDDTGGKVHTGSRGMGRFYSEQIDDNAQYVHFRFGVPEYNGMFTFFTGFYDNDASILAREGRNGGVFYWIGKIAGMVMTFPVWHWIALGYGLRYIFNNPSSKYYYLKQTMFPFWKRVNFIANALAVNMALVPRVQLSDTLGLDTRSDLGEISTKTTEQYHNEAPDIWKKDGGIDVFRVANRAQRLADQDARRRIELFDTDADVAVVQEKLRTYMNEFKLTDPGGLQLDEYLKMYHGTNSGNESRSTKEANFEAISQDASENVAGAGDNLGDALYRAKWKKGEDGIFSRVAGYFSPVGDDILANVRDGSQFVTFKVDHIGSVSESFSNSTKESDISSKFNGNSSSARNTRFSFSEGNTGMPGVDAIKTAVSDVFTGVIDGVQMSGLFALAGSAFVDIPKHWDQSSANFTTANYTMELRSAYGNRMALFQNIYVPLSILLAAALPISTGRQSYASPYLCEMYHRGRNQVRLGMISDLSITRGVGNMGWNNQGQCLAIDVSFSVVNMSNIMHAPIDSGFDFTAPWKGIFDDDSAFNDYLATLGNLSMQDMAYQLNKLALNLTKKREQFDSVFSRSYFANWFGNEWPGRMLSSIAQNGSRGTGRQ